MHIERLIEMANDIAAYFTPDPDAAVDGIAQHIKRFWDPRMRAQIIAHVEGGAGGLCETAHAAILRLAEQQRAQPPAQRA